MSDYILRILEDTEYKMWDRLVEDFPQGSIFHKSYRLEISGGEYRIYGYFKGGALQAGMPVFYKNSRVGLRSIYHPPLTPHLGIVFSKSKEKYVTRLSNKKKISEAFAKRLKVR